MRTEQDNNIHPINLDDEHADNVDLDVFKPVRSSIRLEKLPLFASAIRKRHAGMSTSVACHVLPEPLFGSFHILYQIYFEDGVRWLLKVPATGFKARYDDLIARSLASEAQTMQVLERETTIPVPKILQFDKSFDNEINCPYILMEYVDGIPLQDCWFDHAVASDILEQRRVTALNQIAAAMIQLDKFTYSKGGQFIYSEDGRSITLGPLKCMDSTAELARLETDDPDLTPIFCELGPFEDQTSFLLSLLDRRSSPPDDYIRGINELLRLFIGWLPKHNAKAFVLSHPDFDIQNVIVSEDGSLRGLIDWDGVAAVPRVVGNRSYLGWITRDWDSAKYAWDEEAGSDGKFKENSPEELARYRDIYAEALASASSTSDLPISLTHNSLVLENIRIAADDPFSTHGIVEKIFQEITKLVAPELLQDPPTYDSDQKTEEDRDSTEMQSTTEPLAKEEDGLAPSDADRSQGNEDDPYEDSNSEFYLYDVAIDLVMGRLDRERLNMLKDGFSRLFV